MSITLLEKDLGVNIDTKLDFEDLINIQSKKAKALSGMIMRTFENRSVNILLPIFISLIRPVYEYSNVVWSPYFEKIYKEISLRITGMRSIVYESRLRALKIPSLEYRRVRGNMIKVYRILTNIYETQLQLTLY